MNTKKETKESPIASYSPGMKEEELEDSPVNTLRRMNLMASFSEKRAPSKEEFNILKEHRPEIEKHLGKKFSEWEPLGIEIQQVVGYNLRYTVKTNSGEVTATVYKDLDSKTRLSDIYDPRLIE